MDALIIVILHKESKEGAFGKKVVFFFSLEKMC